MGPSTQIRGIRGKTTEPRQCSREERRTERKSVTFGHGIDFDIFHIDVIEILQKFVLHLTRQSGTKIFDVRPVESVVPNELDTFFQASEQRVFTAER